MATTIIKCVTELYRYGKILNSHIYVFDTRMFQRQFLCVDSPLDTEYIKDAIANECIEDNMKQVEHAYIHIKMHVVVERYYEIR